jgi:hypothetical protein
MVSPPYRSAYRTVQFEYAESGLFLAEDIILNEREPALSIACALSKMNVLLESWPRIRGRPHSASVVWTSVVGRFYTLQTCNILSQWNLLFSMILSVWHGVCFQLVAAPFESKSKRSVTKQECDSHDT